MRMFGDMPVPLTDVQKLCSTSIKFDSCHQIQCEIPNYNSQLKAFIASRIRPIGLPVNSRSHTHLHTHTTLLQLYQCSNQRECTVFLQHGAESMMFASGTSNALLMLGVRPDAPPSQPGSLPNPPSLQLCSMKGNMVLNKRRDEKIGMIVPILHLHAPSKHSKIVFCLLWAVHKRTYNKEPHHNQHMAKTDIPDASIPQKAPLEQLP